MTRAQFCSEMVDLSVTLCTVWLQRVPLNNGRTGTHQFGHKAGLSAKVKIPVGLCNLTRSVSHHGFQTFDARIRPQVQCHHHSVLVLLCGGGTLLTWSCPEDLRQRHR